MLDLNVVCSSCCVATFVQRLLMKQGIKVNHEESVGDDTPFVGDDK